MVMDRILSTELVRHFADNRQMAFLSGPRQVGKTTIALDLCKRLAPDGAAGRYLNWDNQDHRAEILTGPRHVAGLAGATRLHSASPLLALDELRKYRRWRDFLKGLFDVHGDALRILVTGSARLDVFKRGGDSLMGRYFPYTLHPLSVGELVATPDRVFGDSLVFPPHPIDDDAWEALLRFGGFPEPLQKAEQRFYTRWRRLRMQQLFREDVRDLTRVQEVGQLEHLAESLRNQAGQLTGYTALGSRVRISVDTVRRWIAILEALYWCFSVRPWHTNVTRSLRKEPKFYLWDWSLVEDTGARAENLIASALLKTAHALTESGYGDVALHFLRDKQKREVDFVVVRDGKPWFLVEVKTSATTPLSPSLAYFQQQTGARHAFQVAMDLPYVDRDCFAHTEPIIVPARTLLSQLV